MAATTFDFDPRMENTLNDLKVHYGASSKAEILRKAITLLSIAKDAETEDGTLEIMIKGEKVKVLVK